MIKSLSKNDQQKSYYVFDSKLLTHVIFWMAYYLSFSLIWVSELGYFASFYLEFILLPIRVMACYVVIYWLMPRYLLNQKFIQFLLLLFLLLLLCGLLQRLVVFAFYEEFFLSRGVGLFAPVAVLKASLLVNTTVMLVMTIKLVGLLKAERIRNQKLNLTNLVIKAERRTHIVNTEDILFIEGLGNYVKIYLSNGQELTTYTSIKAILEQLSDVFLRCHKSYVINTHHIQSFNNDNIQIRNQQIPRSKDISDQVLLHNHART